MASSPVWKYFTKTVGVVKTKCNICNDLIFRGGQTGKSATRQI